jgi:hypothetical protein
MKHKHEKWIHLMADGVRIERLRDTADEWETAQWVTAHWSDFSFYSTFRISPNQPADKDWTEVECD